MTGFVGAANPVSCICADDRRLSRAENLPERLFADVQFTAPSTYESPWWPKGGGFIGDQGLDIGLIEAAWWGEYDQAAGAASRYGFVGVTRDQYGSPVGSCTVKLYRTSDDVLLDTSTSDPSGNFLLNTAYYPDAHYIVAHKAGSPDIDGVTPNTLIGS